MTRKQAARPFLCGASDVFSPSGRVTLVDPRDKLVRLSSLTRSAVDAFRLVSPEPTETLSVADWHGLTALEDRLGQLRICLAQDWLLDEPGKNISWANLTSEQNAALLRLDACIRQLAAWLATAMERGNHGGRPTELVSSVAELLLLFDAATGKAEKALRSESLPAGVARETPESNGAIGLEERALALLAAHPDWTNTQIAKEVPCSRTTLYKWKKFVAAREAMKTARLDMPRGSKGKDGTLEAW